MPMTDLTIVAADGTWVIRAGGAVIGESERAIEVIEPDRPGVIYFPREDLGMAFLEGSGGIAASPTFGKARLFNLVTSSGVIEDVAWSYETPKPGAEAIAGYLAFYRDHMAIEAV